MGTYIIAEAGVNHNGSIENAFKLVDLAVNAGANAIKFQTFKAENLVTKYAEKAEYQKKNAEGKESQFEMLKQLELTEKDFYEIYKYCNEKKIEFISSPFDVESLKILIDLNVSIIKVASGEITNGPLLLEIGRSKKDIILSTGMATLSEIEDALKILTLGFSKDSTNPTKELIDKNYFSEQNQKLLEQKVSILHCTTEYPAPKEEVNLNVLRTLKSTFGLKVGYSDHTEGIEIPISAVALGAEIIEKHFTLDKNMPGPDHKASLNPEELKLMIKSIRNVEKALGTFKKIPVLSEIKNMKIARKSIVASIPISVGDKFTPSNVAVKRPGNGLSPMKFWDLLNKHATRNYDKDDLIEE